jgi:membrane protein implicated in regulation of membrane protease activity
MLIFASIFGVGFLILLLSLIFGGDSDVDADVDMDVDIDADGHGHAIFNTKMVSLLMVGFGSVGFGVRATTEATMFQSSLAGIGGAVVIGAIGYFIIRAFYASQESSTIADQDLIGHNANLIDAIKDNQTGQVACIIRGREITFLARSIDGKAIDKSVPVSIVSKSGNIVTVKPIG